MSGAYKAYVSVLSVLAAAGAVLALATSLFMLGSLSLAVGSDGPTVDRMSDACRRQHRDQRPISVAVRCIEGSWQW